MFFSIIPFYLCPHACVNILTDFFTQKIHNNGTKETVETHEGAEDWLTNFLSDQENLSVCAEN